MKDLYKSLGVRKEDNDRTIYKTFVRRAYPLHPDKAKDKPSDRQKFIDICQAYYVLGHSESRAIYDQIMGKTIKDGERTLSRAEIEGYIRRFETYGEEFGADSYKMSFRAFKKDIYRPMTLVEKGLHVIIGLLNAIG